MKKLNGLTKVTLAIALGLATSVAYSADPEKTEIRLGKGHGPSSDVFIAGIQPILEKQGYKVTTIVLSDLHHADIALNDGEVDINVEQHTAYIDYFNKNQDADLYGITDIPTMLSAIYPGAKKSLKDVAEGDHFAIPNDASNTARCLAILQKAGLVKFDPKKDFVSITTNDIIENPKKLTFTELFSGTIPTVATDFDYIIIPGPYAFDAKIDPKSALLQEDLRPYLLLQAVVKEGNKDKQWAKDIVKAYRSPEFKEFFLSNYDSGFWYYPEKEYSEQAK